MPGSPGAHERLLHDFLGEPLVAERAIGEPIQFAGVGLHGGAHTCIATQAIVSLDQPQSHTHGRLLRHSIWQHSIWLPLTLRVRTVSALRSSHGGHARDLRCHSAVDSMELKVNTCKPAMFNSSARGDSGVISLLGS